MRRALWFILMFASIVNADYLGSHAIDDYLTVMETLHDSSGDGVAATGAVDIWVYEDDTDVQIVDLTMDAFDSITGLYEQKFQLTAATGFEAGKTYTVLIQATADGASGIITHTFQILASVNVASEDNIDFGAQKKTSLNAATTDLSAITGDKASYKATGFSTHDAAAVKTAIEAGGSSLAQILADSGELQTNQGNWITATGFSTHDAAAVKTAIEAGGSTLAQILADSGELQTNQGAWATATGFSTHDAAAVWAVTMENSKSYAQVMRVFAAVLSGKSSVATDQITFVGIDGTTDRLIVTVSSGARTSVDTWDGD